MKTKCKGLKGFLVSKDGRYYFEYKNKSYLVTAEDVEIKIIGQVKLKSIKYPTPAGGIITMDVEGYLLRNPADDTCWFRRYDVNDKKKYKDYYLEINESNRVEIELLNDYNSLYEEKRILDYSEIK